MQSLKSRENILSGAILGNNNHVDQNLHLFYSCGDPPRERRIYGQRKQYSSQTFGIETDTHNYPTKERLSCVCTISRNIPTGITPDQSADSAVLQTACLQTTVIAGTDISSPLISFKSSPAAVCADSKLCAWLECIYNTK